AENEIATKMANRLQRLDEPLRHRNGPHATTLRRSEVATAERLLHREPSCDKIEARPLERLHLARTQPRLRRTQARRKRLRLLLRRLDEPVQLIEVEEVVALRRHA